MAARNRQIPPERKAVYYCGMALSIVGVLLFLSTFVTAVARIGDFSNFHARARSEGVRAVSGIVLILIGGALCNIGAKGLAGAGIVLDPEKAREDVEPWSRMGGGVVQDALSEVNVVRKLEDRLEPPEAQVKVRCKNCRALNDEAAKFCNQCGAAI